MTDDPKRFQVIAGAGNNTNSPTYRNKWGDDERLRLHACSPCTDATGTTFSLLVQLRLNAVEVRSPKGSRLKGGTLHWCCARCFRPYYLIKTYPSDTP